MSAFWGNRETKEDKHYSDIRNELEQDEIDELPEFDDAEDEIDALPEFDDPGDEIDNLPDMDDNSENDESGKKANDAGKSKDGDDASSKREKAGFDEPNDPKSDIKGEDTNGEGKVEESKESDVEKKDPILEKAEKMITTPEGIKALIERHPEKAELWKSQLKVLDKLNDPEASDSEVNSANSKLAILKGQLLEYAVKDALSDVGFDVESQQRVVEGEKGNSLVDVIAKNNTGHPIEVFGTTIQPKNTLSVECKCGGRSYLTNELKNHIPNQLSAQEGTKMLLTTSDIKGAPEGLVQSVCSCYGAKLVILDVSVADVEKAIKEVEV